MRSTRALTLHRPHPCATGQRGHRGRRRSAWLDRGDRATLEKRNCGDRERVDPGRTAETAALETRTSRRVDQGPLGLAATRRSAPL